MFELHTTQLLMYYGDRRGASRACILCGSLLLPKKIDIENLQHAANEVLRINSGLRTCFVEKDGKVFQEARPFKERVFKVKHFATRDDMDVWCSAYSTIPLNLDRRSEGTGLPKSAWKSAKPPLKLVGNILLDRVEEFFTRAKLGLLKSEPACCEVILLELPDASGAVVKLHHAIADAWTVRLIANQFLSILNGDMPEAYDFQEFIESEKAFLNSRRCEKDRQFMAEQLERCSEPSRLWPKPYTSLRSKRSTVELDADLTNRIRDFAAAHELTPYVLFLTAVCVYMHSRLKRDLFYVGSVALNRTGVRQRNTTGMFVREVPLLIEMRDTDRFADVLERVRDVSFAGFRHQKGATQIRDQRKYLYDVWVSYVDVSLDACSGVECKQYYCKYSSDMTIFNIEDWGVNGSFKLHFDYNVKIAESEADDLLSTVLTVLEKGTEDEGRQIAEFCQ